MEANAPRPELPDTRQQDLSPGDPSVRERVQEQRPQEIRETRESNPAGRGGGEEKPPAWPFLVLVPVLLVAVTPLAKRALLARGRPEDLYRDLVGRLRDALPPGRSAIADSPALTPTERILLLAGAVGVEEEPMREFARAYSDHLYSADGGASHVSLAHRRAMRAYKRLPRWRRVLGITNPASLLARAKRGASAWRVRFLKGLRGALRQSRR